MCHGKEITKEELILDEAKEIMKKAKGGTERDRNNGGRGRERGLTSIAEWEIMQRGCRL